MMIDDVIIAIKANNKEKLEEFLKVNNIESNKISIELLQKKNESILHYAVAFSSTKFIEWLLDVPEVFNNIDILDNFGRSPLCLAVQLGRLNVAKTLLNEGANPLTGSKKYEWIHSDQRLVQSNKLDGIYDIDLNFSFDASTPLIERYLPFLKENPVISPYSIALLRYGAQKRKIEMMKLKKDTSRRKFLYLSKEMKLEHTMVNLLNQHPDVERKRSIYLFQRAFFKTLLHCFLLVVITFIGVSSSTNWVPSTKLLVQRSTETVATTPLRFDVNPWGLTFPEIHDKKSFWDFLEGPLLQTIFTGDNMTRNWPLDDQNDAVNEIIIRQIRVKPGSCPPRSDIRNTRLFLPGDECYGAYSEENEERNEMIRPMFNQSWDDWKVILPSYVGPATNTIYPPTGYFTILSGDPVEAAAIFQSWKKEQWINESTRLISVMYTGWNAAFRRVIPVTLLLEIDASGLFQTQVITRSIQWSGGDNNIIITVIIDGIILMFLLGVSASELLEMKNNGMKKYLCDAWNWLDLVTIMIFTMYLVDSVYMLNTAAILSGLITVSSGGYDAGRPNGTFHLLAEYTHSCQSLLAMCTLIVWLKLLKIMTKFPLVGPIVQAISKTFSNIRTVTVLCILSIVILSTSFCGFIAFGTTMSEFNAFNLSLINIYNGIFVDVLPIAPMLVNDRNNGILIFFLVSLLANVFLLNIFIAVLTDAYVSESKIAQLEFDEAATEMLQHSLFSSLVALQRRQMNSNTVTNAKKSTAVSTNSIDDKSTSTTSTSSITTLHHRRSVLEGHSDSDIETQRNKNYSSLKSTTCVADINNTMSTPSAKNFKIRGIVSENEMNEVNFGEFGFDWTAPNRIKLKYLQEAEKQGILQNESLSLGRVQLEMTQQIQSLIGKVNGIQASLEVLFPHDCDEAQIKF